MDIRASLVPQAINILLRYLRLGTRVNWRDTGTTQFDRSATAAHWALSMSVAELADAVCEEWHQVRRPLVTRTFDGAEIRGSIDVTATLLLQLSTGNTSRFVSQESVRDPLSDANLALVGALDLADYVLDVAGLQYSNSALPMQLRNRASRIAEARSVLKKLLPNVGLRQMAPIPIAVAAARRAKTALYQRAADSLELYAAVLVGDPVGIARIISESVTAPQDDWRLFELYVAAVIVANLEKLTGMRAEVKWILPGLAGPFATVGPYDLFWQSTPPEARIVPETIREARTREFQTAFGFRRGADRPDLVIRHRDHGVIGLVEAKLTAADNARASDAQLREAIEQLARYSEAYHVSTEGQNLLVASSLIAIWGTAPSHHAERVEAVPTVALVAEDVAAIERYCVRQLFRTTTSV